MKNNKFNKKIRIEINQLKQSIKDIWKSGGDIDIYHSKIAKLQLEYILKTTKSYPNWLIEIIDKTYNQLVRDSVIKK